MDPCPFTSSKKLFFLCKMECKPLCHKNVTISLTHLPEILSFFYFVIRSSTNGSN